MIKYLLTFIIYILTLTGCGAKGYFINFDDELRPFIGKPQNKIIAALGLPDQKIDLSDRTVYIWTTEEGDTNCKIKIAMKNDIITNYTYEYTGDELICNSYKFRLQNYNNSKLQKLKNFDTNKKEKNYDLSKFREEAIKSKMFSLE